MPGTMKPIIISGIAKLRKALNTVEKETKSCTMKSVAMDAPVASLMPLIIPGVSKPMSTPDAIAMRIHARRGSFLSAFIVS